MSQLKYYDTGTSQWLPAVVGVQGTQGTQGIQGVSGSSYTQPTIGTTPIPSGATVSSISNLALNNASLQGPTTANPTYVSVASLGSSAGAVSNDGVTWTATTLPSTGNWSKLAFGNGIFFALRASSSNAAYSTNGSTWTATSLPSAFYWRDVAYGASKFVVVGDDGTPTTNVATSTDGITWTTQTNSNTANLIGFGNNLFVAIAPLSSTYSTSADGITWTSRTFATYPQFTGIVYGSKWVIVATGTTTGLYSTNGTSWTTMTMPSAASWTSVTYGGGKFVAVASGSNTVAYSTDGITWSTSTLPVSGTWSSVTYGNGNFVASRDASGGLANGFAYSTDGITWVGSTAPSYETYQAVTYGAPSVPTSGTLTINGSTGTSGQVVTSSGTGVSWVTPATPYLTPNIGTTSINSGATTSTIQNLTLDYVTITNNLTAGGTYGTSGQVLTSNGYSPSWQTPTSGATSVYSATLTGNTSYNITIPTNSYKELIIDFVLVPTSTTITTSTIQFNGNTGSVYYAGGAASTGILQPGVNTTTNPLGGFCTMVIPMPSRTTTNKSVIKSFTRQSSGTAPDNIIFGSTAAITAVNLTVSNTSHTVYMSIFGI